MTVIWSLPGWGKDLEGLVKKVSIALLCLSCQELAKGPLLGHNSKILEPGWILNECITSWRSSQSLKSLLVCGFLPSFAVELILSSFLFLSQFWGSLPLGWVRQPIWSLQQGLHHILCLVLSPREVCVGKIFYLRGPNNLDLFSILYNLI